MSFASAFVSTHGDAGSRDSWLVLQASASWVLGEGFRVVGNGFTVEGTL